MNPNDDFIDDDVPEEPLTSNRNGSSSQVSQPPASLEIRLQDLSLTTPVSTLEASSQPFCCFLRHICNDPRWDQIAPGEPDEWRPETGLYGLRFLREQRLLSFRPRTEQGLIRQRRLLNFLRSTEQERTRERCAIARIYQHGMGSTPSFPGADHKVNGREDAADGATCSTSTGTNQERNGGGKYVSENLLI
ncbi:uncharacterized protein TNCV_5109861 [Trichonephila clavipes]|nr:uncharacterized protein TNCV_5109861 [Trichonephila clavipes]